ncbi:gas vesicle protein GvpA/GvpJ/GvpM family [Eilatimonas milleporae]|uniref:Gas vesicle protein GvpA/GvpJ/GvpM family n=1 Tax=Eilatimonas milleporae TaxID=911205 RepID=A0A3M0CS06_9PROT|nr:gas vesicle protein GvpA/GvpJ/GvpM family [Eilatimonas milleporae]
MTDITGMADGVGTDGAGRPPPNSIPGPVPGPISGPGSEPPHQPTPKVTPETTPETIPETIPGPVQRLALAELLDRALTKGVVVRGDITISLADVDLLYVGLKAVLASSDRAEVLFGRDGFQERQGLQGKEGDGVSVRDP